jgi:hypothetical protein
MPLSLCHGSPWQALMALDTVRLLPRRVYLSRLPDIDLPLLIMPRGDMPL